MKPFEGFPPGKTRQVSIPETFFTEILANVDDIHVLKLLLHFFRILNFQEGSIRFIKRRALMEDVSLPELLCIPSDRFEDVLLSSMQQAIKQGFILEGMNKSNPEQTLYFLNTARGRDALSAYESGKWIPDDSVGGMEIPAAIPGIFQMYEENIGPITPMIADMLQAAEKEYPPALIQFAFEEAVKQNARTWKYIDAILRNWQEKGSHGKNSGNPEKDRRKYIEGEYAEFINHE
jgi:DnaD/phage-associated family protein